MVNKTLVMKFGGASVATPEHFSAIADLIIRRRATYSRLAIVVSAMGQTTDQLIGLAKQIHPAPPQREYDMLVSVGERISMALLAMALCYRGYEAISFTGSQSGILTCAHHSDARIIDVRPYRLTDSFENNKIVIVAGFQGVSLQKEITTLGRGGSDTTAVALAIALGADLVEFYKPVSGVFDRDPHLHPQAIRHTQLNYTEALDIVEKGAKVLHPRAIRLANKNGLPLCVRSFMSSNDNNEATWIRDSLCPRQELPVYEETPA